MGQASVRGAGVARGGERQLDEPSLRAAAADALVLGHVRLEERHRLRVVLARERTEGLGERWNDGAGEELARLLARAQFTEQLLQRLS